MSSTLGADFVHGRRRWFQALVGRIVNARVEKTFADNTAKLSTSEKALLVAHAGLSHVYGIADGDIEVDGFLSGKEVQLLISHNWREGNLDARIASHTDVLWQCIYRLGRDLDEVRPEILSALFNSQLGRREQGETTANLEPAFVDTTATDVLFTDPVQPAALEGDRTSDLDVEGSHLPIVRGMAKRSVEDAARCVTMLELIACMPDNDRHRWNTDALEASSNQVMIHMSIPGGWPGPNATDVPDWVTDTVLTNGARMWYASAGLVPGWLIVAESDDELRAINHWTYEKRLLVGEEDAGRVAVLGMQLTLPSTGEQATAEWRYLLNDVRSLVRLKALMAMGLIRLDIYKIGGNAQLEYVYSYGFHLPLEFIQCCREILDKNEPSGGDLRLFSPLTPEQQLSTMAQIEQHAFEGVHRGLSAVPGSALAVAFQRYLEVLDATTSAVFGGFPADVRPPIEARESLRIAIASSSRNNITELDLASLGSDRAYVQITATRDEPVLLVAQAAFLDAEHSIVIESHEFAGPFSDAWPLETQSEALAKGLEGLRRVIDKRITKLVVNAHSVAYNLPYHEAFLRNGFAEVSYTHRAASLKRRPKSTAHGAVTCGFAGDGTKFIQGVDTELEIVARLYQTARSEFPPRKLPATVHLAGHGYAGFRSYEVGLEVQASQPLSSARVLLDFDASDTEVVFLSACSSGRGSFYEQQLAEAIPLDVAFLEKGARVVLSTAAPVNDFVACFFACVFHWARVSGQSIWNAYALARQATRSRQLPIGQLHLRDLLDESWPNWKQDLQDLSVSSADDWQLFRLSGRHWE